MIIYHAGLLPSYEHEISQVTRRRLISYLDFLRSPSACKIWTSPFEEGPPPDVFLDSGAFTAFTQGTVIDLDQYIEFIQENESWFTVYASLDVIGDWSKTRENLDRMTQVGLRPIPTFHYGSPVSELHRLCKEFSYIALGGLVPLASSGRLRPWLDLCFRCIRGYWPIKVHLFGVTTQWVLERYPAFSSDSTSAVVGGGLGRVMRWERGEVRSRHWFEDVRRHGDLDLVVRGENNTQHMNRRRHNIETIHELEAYLTRLWDHRKVWDQPLTTTRP